MTQHTIKSEGAFTDTIRNNVNANFTELYANISTLQGLVQTDFKALAADLAATGNSQGTSALIVTNVVNATAADGTKGVRLPAAVAGKIVMVYNSVATNGLPIYPATSGTINGGTGDAAVTIEGKTLAIFVGTDTTNWAAIYTANT